MNGEVTFRPLADVVVAKAGNNKIIKGDQSLSYRAGLIQGFSASGPDVWVSTADYTQPGVVLSAVGARCGKTFAAEGAWTAIANTHVLLPSPSIDHRWLWYLTNNEAFWIRGGSAQPFVKVRETLQKRVFIPSLVEQRRIVAILDEAFEGIATAKAHAERNLRNAWEVFESRLEQMFVDPDVVWRTEALDSIGVTQTGSTPKTSEPENYGAHMPFVKPGDFNRDGTIGYENEGLSELGVRKARLVAAGSALMVCIGATIGKAGYTEREVTTNQQVNAWTPTGEIPGKFIYYQMISKDFQRRVREGAGQATLPIINKSKWSALTVVVPQAPEDQNRIVEELDALQADSMSLEDVYQRKLAALDELKQSLLHQAFSGQL